MFAWGANSHGQLALDSTEDKSVPTKVNVLIRPLFAASGGVFSVIADQSSIWIAGKRNENLCNDSQTIFHQLGEVSGGIRALSCGWNFLILLTMSGRIFFQGENHPGFPFDEIPTPKWVESLKLVKLNCSSISSVAAGLRHAVIVSDYKQVVEWKRGKVTSLPVNITPRIVGCSAGERHSAILTEDGHVGVWGNLKFGQGGTSTCKVNSTNGKSDVIQWIEPKHFHNERVVSIKCGWHHVLALTVRGKVFSWGRCDMGQLGRLIQVPETSNKPDSAWPQAGLVFDPKPGVVPLSCKIKSISAGSEHCLALTHDGQLWSWGWNEHGSCGVVINDDDDPADYERITVSQKRPSSESLSDVAGVTLKLARNKDGSVRQDERTPSAANFAPYQKGWSVNLPRRVEFPGHPTVLLAAAGYGHSLAYTVERDSV